MDSLLIILQENWIGFGGATSFAAVTLFFLNARSRFHEGNKAKYETLLVKGQLEKQKRMDFEEEQLRLCRAAAPPTPPGVKYSMGGAPDGQIPEYRMLAQEASSKVYQVKEIVGSLESRRRYLRNLMWYCSVLWVYLVAVYVFDWAAPTALSVILGVYAFLIVLRARFLWRKSKLLNVRDYDEYREDPAAVKFDDNYVEAKGEFER